MGARAEAAGERGQPLAASRPVIVTRLGPGVERGAGDGFAQALGGSGDEQALARRARSAGDPPRISGHARRLGWKCNSSFWTMLERMGGLCTEAQGVAPWLRRAPGRTVLGSRTWQKEDCDELEPCAGPRHSDRRCGRCDRDGDRAARPRSGRVRGAPRAALGRSGRWSDRSSSSTRWDRPSF